MRLLLIPFVCSVLSLPGGSTAGDPVELPACCENGTLGAYDKIQCDQTYPGPGFHLWPNHTIEPGATITCLNHIQLEGFGINTDGTLVYWNRGEDLCTAGPHVEYNRSDYCLDYDLSQNKTVAHVCFVGRKKPTDHLAQKICSVISAVLLILTIAIYVFNKSLKKWSNGAYLISQSTSLAIAFLCLARLQFFPKDLGCIQCLVAGYCLQYFFLAAFFWMNTHCINIYLTVSRCYLMHGSPALDEMRKKRFLCASLYAWGVPLVISGITFAMQNIVPVTDWNFRPDVGLDACFLTGWTVKMIYFYAPMAVIIVANLVLFILTFTILCKHRINSRHLRTNQSSLKREQWYYKQYFKLFIITGLSWAGEVIGYTFKKHDELDTWGDYLWLVLDAFNSLQGLFIFIIFVCPKETRRTLKWLPGNTGKQNTSFFKQSRYISGASQSQLNGLNTRRLTAAKFSKANEEATLMATNQGASASVKK